MPPVVIDACCLIGVLTTGRAQEILRAVAGTWCVPTSVQSEILFVRRYDSDRPGGFVKEPVDLTPLLATELLTSCDIETEDEADKLISHSPRFRKDGEAMCLALAEARKWIFATDDRIALNVARAVQIPTMSTPTLVRSWVERTNQPSEIIAQVLRDYRTLSRFFPDDWMDDYAWWLENYPAGQRGSD